MKLELTGIKEIDEKALNLSNTINTLSKYTDVSKYEKRLEEIVEEVKRSFDERRGFTGSFSTNMKVDYAIFSCTEYAQEIDNLIKDINNNELPFYYIYELNEKIEKESDNFSLKNIDELIDTAIKLLEIINDIELYDNESKQKEITRTYKNIYKVLKLEAIYDRTRLLEFIRNQANGFAREYIHSSMQKEINNINNVDIINDRIKGIDFEGLEYDPVNQEIILKLSEAENPAARKSFKTKKINDIGDINKKIIDFNDRVQKEIETYHEEKKEYKRDKRNHNFETILQTSLLTVPVLLTTIGGIIGHNHNKTKYEVTTTDYDLTREEIINQEKKYSTEFWVNNEIVIKKYEPWEETKKGYTRTVTEYKCYGELDLNDDKIPSLEKLQKHMVRSDIWEETSEAIDHNDNKTYYTINYSTINKDKEKSKNRTGLGISLGIITSLLYLFMMTYMFDYDLDFDFSYNKDLTEEFKKKKEKLEKLKEEREYYLKEKERIRNMYGIHADDIFISEPYDIDIKKATKH